MMKKRAQDKYLIYSVVVEYLSCAALTCEKNYFSFVL